MVKAYRDAQKNNMVGIPFHIDKYYYGGQAQLAYSFYMHIIHITRRNHVEIINDWHINDITDI